MHALIAFHGFLAVFYLQVKSKFNGKKKKKVACEVVSEIMISGCVVDDRVQLCPNL